MAGNVTSINSATCQSMPTEETTSTESKPNTLYLQEVLLFNPEEMSSESLKTKYGNYYRATDVFGDIATKKDLFPNQEFVPSTLNEKTKTTPIVEDVVAKVDGNFEKKDARDAKMADIFAKQIGTWSSDGKILSGGFALEKTDAYKFALAHNSDDFTNRETSFRGQKETHAFLDLAKSDKKITLFSLENVDGKEYFTMRDKDNNIHYFDRSNNLKEVKL